jgi:hypothetical protein
MAKTYLPASDNPGAGAVRDGRVRAVREFNRVYTNMIGLLRGGYLGSPYSLTDARVLFELAQGGEAGAARLRSARCAGPWTSTPAT